MATYNDISLFKKVAPTQTFNFSSHKDTALTALEGDGQQCKAAPAWTASTEPDAKGSLETSALTRAILLQTMKWNSVQGHPCLLIQKGKKHWICNSLAAFNSESSRGGEEYVVESVSSFLMKS